MKKKLKGIIISDKMKNTAVVKVDRLVAHPKYHKRFKVSKKYKAHTEGDNFKVGDVVIIEACRPISKDKKFRIVEKIVSNS
jgi:small subunit ribosomal protein S17